MALAEDILNRAIAVGDEKAAKAEQLGDEAILASLGASYIVPPTVDPTPEVAEPAVTIPQNATGIDQALYNSTYNRIINDLSDMYASFLVEYFPVDPALMTSVEAWLRSAIEDGGTGVNAAVEAKIWQRDRDRITTEAAAASDTAVASWAARGYPLPPGAAVAAVQEIQLKKVAEIANQSREIAMNMFKTEIENVRFAVGKAIDYRVAAVSAAADYIRALALAPQVATQLATAASDAQAKLISAASTYYNARINVAQLAQQKSLAVADNNLRAAVQSSQNAVNYSQLRANTAVAVAQSLGQQAAAALNAVNATSQLIETVA